MRFPWQYVTYRVLVINTHVGIGIQNGVFTWVRKNMTRRFNIVLASEVKGRIDVDRLQEALGPAWHIYSKDSKNIAGNYVCLKNRRKRFSASEVVDRDIRFDGRWHRALRAVRVWDRRAGRWLNVSSIHPDPIPAGIQDANPRTRQRHIRQVQAYIDWHRQNRGPGETDLCGGDVNEKLDPNVYMKYHPDNRLLTAPFRFRRIDMEQGLLLTEAISGPIRVMGLFVGDDPFIRVTRRMARDTGIRGMDHEVVMYWIKVKKAPRK